MTKGITDIDEGTVRRIDWQELVPASMFVRAFSMSLSPFAVFVSTFVIAILIGLAIHFGMISAVPVELSPHFDSPCDFGLDLTSVYDRWYPVQVANGMFTIVAGMVCAAILSFLWLLFARSAAVRFASTQRSSFVHSFAFAARKFKSVVLALALPSVLIIFLGVLLAMSVRMEQAGWWLNWLNHLFFPLFIALAFFRVVLIAVTVCSVPLVISAVATDNSDGFDAISRAVSYVTQRPLHFVFYLLLAAIPALLGGKLLAAFTTAVINNYAEYFWIQSKYTSFWWMDFWKVFLVLIPVGYLFHYTVLASTALYFMLRRSVDGAPFDQCHTTDSHRPSRKLRPIIRDSQGAPVSTGSAFDSGRD